MIRSRTIVFVLLIVAALLYGQVAYAQDLTATPPVPDGVTIVPSDPTAGTPIVVVAPSSDEIPVQYVWAFVVFTVVLLAAVALVLRPLILKLGESAPPAAMEAAFAMVDSLLTSGQRFADRTESPVDNLAMTELRHQFELLRTELRSGNVTPTERASPPPAV